MNREKCGIKADFLQHPQRRLFYVLLEPSGIEAHSSILFLHPFADEMHKSRHIVASCARALAAAGHNVMLLDLSGCGDGAGDFADVSWQIWLEDARFALAALTRLSAAPVALWGLRTGALLACELSAVETGVRKLMMWQPVLNGEQQIDQFLRLRTVGTSATGTAGFDRKMLWCELRSGRSLEIVGYELPSALALEMAKVRLNDITPGCPVSWLEVASGG